MTKELKHWFVYKCVLCTYRQTKQPKNQTKHSTNKKLGPRWGVNSHHIRDIKLPFQPTTKAPHSKMGHLGLKITLHHVNNLARYDQYDIEHYEMPLPDVTSNCCFRQIWRNLLQKLVPMDLHRWTCRFITSIYLGCPTKYHSKHFENCQFSQLWLWISCNPKSDWTHNLDIYPFTKFHQNSTKQWTYMYGWNRHLALSC